MFLEDSSNAWKLLIDGIQDGLCIPIIGPQVSQHVMHSRGDIAERMAGKYHYPGRSSERRELRKVAQYAATTETPRSVRKQYEQAVIEYLTERYGDAIPTSDSRPDVLVVLKGVWDTFFLHRADDPYNLLAKLNLPLYLSTNLHNYLSLAMEDLAGREPRSEAARPTAVARERIFAQEERILGEEEDLDERTFMLDKDRPLVYHLFGRLDKPETMILTEDDHFRFLLRFPSKWARLASRVRSHISDSALLFLGFDLAEWEFRSVFRSLLTLAGSDVFRDNTHVAVQINVDDDTISDPERTQAYLVDYFKQISLHPYVFFGSAQEFLTELDQRLTNVGYYES
jgi:hypothetical protein